jgi:cell division protein FtsI/penicillin-binding protein 2
VREEIDTDGRVTRPAEPKGRALPIEPRHLALMREAMEGAFDGPHLKDFKIPELRAAGKTGTAEYGTPDAQGNLPSHGWFTGFAPADDPVVAIAVFVEQGTGTTDASPIGARILRRFFGLPDTPAQPTPTPGPGQP